MAWLVAMHIRNHPALKGNKDVDGFVKIETTPHAGIITNLTADKLMIIKDPDNPESSAVKPKPGQSYSITYNAHENGIGFYATTVEIPAEPTWLKIFTRMQRLRRNR